MATSHENYISSGHSSGLKSWFEPMNVERLTQLSAYDRNMFHPYAGGYMNRQRNGYKSYFANGNYPEISRYNEPMPFEQFNYFSGSLQNIIGSTFLPHSQKFKNEPKHTNYQWTLTPEIIQNLCQLNADTGTSLQNTLSAAGKDRSHPFYSRKREEPAKGMMRTRDKYRVVYTEKKRRGLEEEYRIYKFITTEIKEKISEKLSARQIKIWFQNRRAKERRDSRRDKCKEQTGNCSSEDDDYAQKHSPSSLDDTNEFLTSCRFTISGKCRFSNQTNTTAINTNSTAFSSSCFIESRDFQNVEPPESPSEWCMATGNSFIPDEDVSTLSGIVNIDKELRL